MLSEKKQRSMLVMVGYGRHRSQWVKIAVFIRMRVLSWNNAFKGKQLFERGVYWKEDTESNHYNGTCNCRT